MTSLNAPSLSTPCAGIAEFLETTYAKQNLVLVKKGNAVPLLKKQIWIVVRGLIILEGENISDDDAFLGLVGPNEPFGECLTSNDACQAKTLTNSYLFCVRMSELFESHELAMTLVNALSARYRRAESSLVVLGIKSTEERIKVFLEQIALNYGQSKAEGLLINFKLTYKVIADALGITRVTVTRVINRLCSNGWLKKVPNGFLITGKV